YLLLPALFAVYLFFAPAGWLRRTWHLLAAGVVLAVSSFWWMVVVDLIPASSRPYIGGSTDHTVWDLVIGHNGLGGGAGGGGRPGRRRGELRRGVGRGAAVQLHRRRADLVAAAVRLPVADRVRLPATETRLTRAVGRLAGGPFRDLQLLERHDAPLLHDGPGP